MKGCWKHRAMETWEWCITCWFQITDLSCVSVACIPTSVIVFMCRVNFFLLFSIISQKSKCIHWAKTLFLISWMSVWYLLKSVVASVLVKNQQWPLKAILNVVYGLVLKEWIFSSMLHWYSSCELPVNGSVVSHLICLRGFFSYMVYIIFAAVSADSSCHPSLSPNWACPSV